ncbi:FadR/GntR family transcriptional regulator [Shouchella shacheensis]|uniref:FadR/GntR family transcriptional regulator n=1 Tax=Shouchella shacheensis TaxID=1649580 RepID=UPI0007400A4C|nr:FCD domain-containing protein [Shouchella shacheensis]
MIEHKRLYEQVLDKLMDNYKQGLIQIGDRIPPERKLAETLGVSRGTLRDAFRVLESMGIIQTIPGGGRILKKELSTSKDVSTKNQEIIMELKKAAVLELIEAREIMEVPMLDLIIDRASENDIEHMKTILKEKDIDYLFHETLAALSGNTVLLNFTKLNLDLIHQARSITYVRKEKYDEANREHWAIVEAVEQRNKQLARTKMMEHLENIRQRLYR